MSHVLRRDSALPGGGVLTVVAFAVAGERLALGADRVDRVLPMAAVSPLPGAPPVALGALNVGGLVTPVLDVRRRLGCEPREYGPSAHLLVARTTRRVVALAVDEVLGLRELTADDVRPPAAVLPRLAHVEGVAALADGLLVICDLDSFLSLDEERLLATALEAVEP
ncbi:MAG TPA: chemotaxis protein CheW [Gaiellaceae bacterium]|nr:chemotaxis protein CheW [Gaiellaceae bacterium]